MTVPLRAALGRGPEVRIIGSKSNLLRTLTAAAGVKSATPAFAVLF